MGSGVPSGLQNQYEGLVASWVSSILTRSRQKKNEVNRHSSKDEEWRHFFLLSIENRRALFEGVFCVI